MSSEISTAPAFFRGERVAPGHPEYDRLYGDRFQRLRELKRRWVPDNVFAGSHNIQPAVD